MADSITPEDLATLLAIRTAEDFEARQQISGGLAEWMRDEELEAALGRGYVVAYSIEDDPGRFVPEPYRRYEGSWREEKYRCQFFHVSESGRQLVHSAPMSIWERCLPD